MEIRKYIIENIEYIFIGKFNIKDKEFYKFSNENESVYCTLENGNYVKITSKRILKKITDMYENNISKDIV